MNLSWHYKVSNSLSVKTNELMTDVHILFVKTYQHNNSFKK